MTNVQSASSREVTPRMRRSIRPPRATSPAPGTTSGRPPRRESPRLGPTQPIRRPIRERRTGWAGGAMRIAGRYALRPGFSRWVNFINYPSIYHRWQKCSRGFVVQAEAHESHRLRNAQTSHTSADERFVLRIGRRKPGPANVSGPPMRAWSSLLLSPTACPKKPRVVA